MKRLVIGILAHVDAGKTTLSEGILYQTGTIRRLGRVDNRDAFLDTYELERNRGITIFSKQAVFELGDTSITLLDTPGHVDFSAEMERTLQVLDYAVLVVSGADGVQGHTGTLWELLKRYRVPVFIFVNKMDQDGTDWRAILKELRKRLDGNCVPFNGLEYAAGRIAPALNSHKNRQEKTLTELNARGVESMEELAMCDETIMEDYLEMGSVSGPDACRLIRERRLFPCYFGSALKLWGVEELLDGIQMYGETQGMASGGTQGMTNGGTQGMASGGTQGVMQGGTPGGGEGEAFGARVFKISRDEQGNRMTHMKITSGRLQVKDTIRTGGDGEEKVNQIRIYSGTKYETAACAEPGMVCEVTGLLSTCAGQGLGTESKSEIPFLEPVLTYQIILPPGSDVHGALSKLRQLEEEDPMLRITWNEELEEIQAQVMGEVQIEILKSLIKERFGISAEFGAGHIVYRETILSPVEGVGHFEPLRHYAEVHLLMEPAEPGSGLTFAADCSSDVLDMNWQRLILTHLRERRHPGVLTGSEITDMKITLIAGRAHLKHTEGGDFRQATYRALRQGLREAMALGKCRLLEPVYQFRLEVPSDSAGRALADLERMQGRFDGPRIEGDMAVITGDAPVVTMRNYQSEVAAYTRGRGRLSCSLKGYEPCHNEEQVLEAAGYDPDLDPANPCDSVFCSHGAGYLVSWDHVKEYMHVESPIRQDLKPERSGVEGADCRRAESGVDCRRAEDRELEAIFTRTYGERKERKLYDTQARHVSYDREKQAKIKEKPPVEEYLLVDGYNIIFAWDELRDLAKTTIDGARRLLMDIMCNYQGYTGCILILVFDAYKVEGSLGQVIRYHNINVVYTKEAETADQYIEKLAHQMGRDHSVTVATSDGLEQLIIRGQGCRLLSAQDLREAVEDVNDQIRTEHLRRSPFRNGNYLLSHAKDDLKAYLEDVRLGKEGEYHEGKTDKKRR